MINRVNWEYWFVLTGYMYTLTNIVDASLSEMNKYHFYQDQHWMTEFIPQNLDCKNPYFSLFFLVFFLSSCYYDRGNHLYLHLVNKMVLCVYYLVIPDWFLLIDVFVSFTALSRLLFISIDGPLQTYKTCWKKFYALIC